MVNQLEKIKSNSRLFTTSIKTHEDNLILQAENGFNQLRKDTALKTSSEVNRGQFNMHSLKY